MATGAVNPAWIAQRTALAIDAEGREFALTFGVGTPYDTGTGEWVCAMSLDGLLHAPLLLHGVDSWQALQLAMQLAAQLLHNFVVRGGLLLWPEQREPMLVAELIPQIPPVAVP